jgi:hypothetical protein
VTASRYKTMMQQINAAVIDISPMDGKYDFKA